MRAAAAVSEVILPRACQDVAGAPLHGAMPAFDALVPAALIPLHFCQPDCQTPLPVPETVPPLALVRDLHLSATVTLHEGADAVPDTIHGVAVIAVNAVAICVRPLEATLATYCVAFHLTGIFSAVAPREYVHTVHVAVEKRPLCRQQALSCPLRVKRSLKLDRALAVPASGTAI